MKTLILALLLIVTAVPAFASVTYTKENLTTLYSKGKLPKVGPAVTIDDTAMDFSECRNQGNETYTSSIGNYPAKVIIDSGVLYTLKLWKENALIVFNCSRTDGKRTMTQADYQ
ncbi:hypothetical protein GTU79_19840 [Sodalis ligni]|uniref:hypothetical protein n=1 Tax=Sodalis ligni TaxID=2697027 RepID=UPI00193EF9FC|nr:hypothetical protein [Sodalis ligni]QWA09591.1 hypothetical protein GTU79_19840 [Sodalis ligni]